MTVIDRSSPVETFEFRMAVRLDRGKLPLTRNGVRTRPPFFADERAWTTALIRYLTRFPILSICRETRIGQQSVQRSLRQEKQVSKRVSSWSRGKTGSVGQGCWHEDEKQVAVQQDVQVLRQEVGVARASTPDRGRVDRGTETVRRGNHFSCSGIWRFWITWIMLCKRTRTKYVRIWIFFSFGILLVTRIAIET